MNLNRQMVVIAISKINRLSKQLAYSIELGIEGDITKMLPEIKEVNQYRSLIMRFMLQHPCFEFLDYIAAFHDSNIMHEFIKNNSANKQNQIILGIFADMIDKLKDFGANYIMNYKRGRYMNLTDTFSNDEALKVFEKVRDAGFLTKEFQPKENVSFLQLKFLAWAIFTTLKLPKRKQWAALQEQWHISGERHLSNIHVPELNTKEMDSVQKIFPELDFSVFVNKREDQFFAALCDDDRIHTLYISLMVHKYIDSQTSYMNFKKIFGRGSVKDFTPVNWIQDGAKLSYFIRIAIAPTNYQYWAKTKNCFTIKGRTPNLCTLSSSISSIKAKGLWDDFDPTLKSIAELFCCDIYK